MSKIDDIRSKFISYFVGLGYKEISNSPIIPENDPSVLFTTAGMQQFKPYFVEPNDAPAPKAVTVQQVIRTTDIDEIGDDTHLTSFEMLGNFIFGQKDLLEMKRTAINEAWRFITEELGIDRNRIFVTVFEGNDDVERDEVSAKIWRELGMDKIEYAGLDNFWGPTGDEGPCGPTTEIYVDGIEVWNLVFNQYYKDAGGRLEKLNYFGLDTGCGLERLAVVVDRAESIWQIEPYSSWILKNGVPNQKTISNKEKRVLADSLKTSAILIDNNILPGKNGREAVLRRFLRKVIFIGHTYAIESQIEAIYTLVGKYYQINREKISSIYRSEVDIFLKVIERASRELDKWYDSMIKRKDRITEEEVSKEAFLLYQSYGFPVDLSFEYVTNKGLSLSSEIFNKLFIQHQEVSRQGWEKQFKGGLADNKFETIAHHTAHHLLLAALRKILGNHVVQRGSNVNSERLRLDFTHGEKVNDEQKDRIEKIVNQWIDAKLPVVREEMPKDKALKLGALAEFGQKYGDVVTVYTIRDGDDIVSRELCGGPHVTNTEELGHFKIQKEEASSQGVRRIKAKCQ